MRVDLRVPYHDRHEARMAGARWDPNAGTWWVEAVRSDACRRWLRAPVAAPGGGEKIGPYEKLSCGCINVFPWLQCKHAK